MPTLPEAGPKSPRPRVLLIQPSTGFIVGLLCLLAGLWLLSRLLVVVMILLAALILAGTLGPAVERLQQRGMRRWLAIGIVITALLTVTILFITLTIPSLIAQATSLVNQEPVLRARMGHWLAGSPITRPLA